MKFFNLWFLILPAVLAPGLSVPLCAAEIKIEVQQKKDLSGMACTDCHTVIRDIAPNPDGVHGKCGSCHTDGDKHLNSVINDGIGKATIGMPGSKECMNCHKDDIHLQNWDFSDHGRAGLVCRDCHVNHISTLNKKSSVSAPEMDKNSTMCVKCHQDVSARFNMTSHHPVIEGGLSCISCHDQHGSNKTSFQSQGSQCLSCHQALRGPYAFEHAPAVEDCMNCHTPHGSTSRRLLAVSQPAVCLQCHSIAQGKHGYGTGAEPAAASGTSIISGAVLRNCTNCHAAIHGSQQDPLLRY